MRTPFILSDFSSRVEKHVIPVRGSFSKDFSGLRGDAGTSARGFSGLAKQAIYIENGEVKFPLMETIISENSYEVLQSIIRISSETKVTFTGVYTKPVVTKNIKIVSK